MTDKILKQLAEIMLEQICAYQYAKSEKVFYEHKSQLELIISFMKKLEEENTAYNRSIE